MRKWREHGVLRKLKLATLNEVHQLPRPWHFEFWQTVPDDLPFTLTHLDDDINNNNSTTTTNNNIEIEIVIGNQMECLVRSEPISIESPKPRQLYLSEYFETTETEDQEIVLPSPSRSR